MRIIKILTFTLLPLLMAACISADDINVKGIESFELKSLTRPSLVIDVENRSGKNISLAGGRFMLERDSVGIVEVMLAEEVVVPRKSDGLVTVPLQVRVTDPLVLLSISLGGRLITDDMTVSGEVVAKAGAMSRKFEYEHMPLKKFLSIFGIDYRDLEKMGI